VPNDRGASLFVISLPFHHSCHLLNLNIAARKKLQKSDWLISAMLVVFSHLREGAKVAL
jgi:hypothetical protein